MTAKKENRMAFLQNLFLAVLHWAVFYPVLQLFVPLNQLSSIQPLFYFFVMTHLLFFIPQWFVWLPLQLLAISFTLFHYFPYQETMNVQWFQTFFTQLDSQIRQLITGSLSVYPSILTLLLIILLLTLSGYLLLKKKQVFPSILAGLGYLLILHIYTDTEILKNVVQVLAFGSLLIGTAKIPVWQRWRSFFFSLLILGLFSFFLTRVSYWGMEQLSSQQEWMQMQSGFYRDKLRELGFYDLIDLFSTSAVSMQTGYSENDEQLGGPLQQDFSTVFRAYTDEPHYWRIETKEIYSGIGWEGTPQDEWMVSSPFTNFLNVHAVPGNEIEDIQVELLNNFSYLPYTYGTEEIDFSDETHNLILSYQSPSEQLILRNSSDSASSYNLRVAAPDINPDQLEQVPPIDDSLDLSDYTQLPDELPDRVRELAAIITEGGETPYDQVRLIENYLKREGGFRYSLREATHTPEGRDYVDYFLFDSKIGYCDNYSTAMAVLCRALGIPARWAKGFSSGTLIESDMDESYHEITNANAHSWVEVYFDGYGWIPFEPTPYFSQPVTETSQENAVSDSDNPLNVEEIENLSPAEDAMNDTAAESPEEEEVEESEEPSADMESGSNESVSAETSQSRETGIYFPPYLSIVFFLGFLTGTAILRWKILINATKWVSSWNLFSLGRLCFFVVALFQLKKKKEPQQTLRQYFTAWSAAAPRHEAVIDPFIHLIEETLYSETSKKKKAAPDQKKVIRDLLTVFEKITSPKTRT